MKLKNFAVDNSVTKHPVTYPVWC